MMTTMIMMVVMTMTMIMMMMMMMIFIPWIFFHEKYCHVPAASRCQKMIENANTSLCFLKRTQHFHYNDVIMGAIASQITSLTIVYSIVNSQTQIKENIKAPRHWPLCGKFTGDWWIPRTNGQLRGKCFHLMTSSCLGLIFIILFVFVAFRLVSVLNANVWD